MKSIRELVEPFLYPFLERFTSMVYEGGEDTVYEGIRVLDDDIKFTHGALVNAAATLYAYYARIGDARADEVLARLHYFIKIAASTVCKTWGKLAILRGFATLYDAGLFDKINPQYVELAKEKTNYEDFFDKESLELRGMATNYFQVAMACAGYRERFGWENDGYAEKIKTKLVKILEERSINGWLDDEIPYGRFDRYSLVLSAEFTDTATAVGLEVPKTVKNNLRRAAEVILFMANENGDGIIYGRSVACHGDEATPEILSSALSAGLLNEEEAELATLYSIKTYEKMLDFWYNSERGCFDIWWGGRATNSYRPKERILETNLDIANHIYMALTNFERAGVADLKPKAKMPCPKEWQRYELEFFNQSGNVKKTVIMRRNDILLMLPFVGLGANWGRHNAYYPIPVIPRMIEASPESREPFMLPEYTDDDGNILRPCQYFNEVTVTGGGDVCEIVVRGYLSHANGSTPSRSDIRFEMLFRFAGRFIEMRIGTEKKMAKAEMITGVLDERIKLRAIGFDESNAINTTGISDYSAIHGYILNATRHTKISPTLLGYDLAIL